MGKEVQESIFETVYKEYKEFEEYVKEKALPEIKKSREEFVKFAIDNKKDMEKVLEEMFRVNQSPAFMQTDLVKHQERLFYTYNALKDSIDIPEEIAKEIHQIPRPKFLYKIKSGELVELDPEYYKAIYKATKESYSKSIGELLKDHL